jgi:hypothetical protein
LLGHFKPYGVIVDLLGPRPYLGKNGCHVFAELAQSRACEPCNTAGGAWYRAKSVGRSGAHEWAGQFVSIGAQSQETLSMFLYKATPLAPAKVRIIERAGFAKRQ